MNNLLGAFAMTLATRIHESIKGVGLRSINAASALVTIRNHPDDSIEMLRKTLGLTHSGAVRLINGLVEDQLVERVKSDADARAITTQLTKEGISSAEQVLQARAVITEETLMTLLPEQIGILKPILEQSLSTLTGTQENARRICRLCDESVCRPQGCPVEQAACEGL